jgi:hypothetical protein
MAEPLSPLSKEETLSIVRRTYQEVLLVVRRPLDRERAQNEDGSEKRGDHQAKD